MRPSVLRMSLESSRLGDFQEDRVWGVAGDKAGARRQSDLALCQNQLNVSKLKPFRDLPRDPEQTAGHPIAQKTDQNVTRN